MARFRGKRAYQFDRFLQQRDRTDLLIVDQLGYLSSSRGGSELLFRVFADRYERRSLLLTSNLAFSDWGQIFEGELMTAALLYARSDSASTSASITSDVTFFNTWNRCWAATTVTTSTGTQH